MKIDRFANAIRIFEGWSPGTRSFRNHNPGNLRALNLGKGKYKITEYQKSLGALSFDDKGFLQFPDDAVGERALETFLTDCCNRQIKPYHKFDPNIKHHLRMMPKGKPGDELPDFTLVDFFEVYAPSEDDNNPVHYATFVGDFIDEPPAILIKTLV